jgi:hypothetical protein
MKTLQGSPLVKDIARRMWADEKTHRAKTQLERWKNLCLAAQQFIGPLTPKQLSEDEKPYIPMLADEVIVTFRPDKICGPIRVRFRIHTSPIYVADQWPTLGNGYFFFAIPTTLPKLDVLDLVQWADSMQWYYTNELNTALAAAEEAGLELIRMEKMSGYRAESFPVLETLLKGSR